MRFLDYNGNGGLDPQDIATSVAVGEARREEARREEEAENASSARPLITSRFGDTFRGR